LREWPGYALENAENDVDAALHASNTLPTQLVSGIIGMRTHNTSFHPKLARLGRAKVFQTKAWLEHPVHTKGFKIHWFHYPIDPVPPLLRITEVLTASLSTTLLMKRTMSCL